MPDPEVIEVQEVEGVGPEAVVPDDDDSVETEDKEFGDAFREAIKKATEPEGEKVEEKPAETKPKEKPPEKKEEPKPSGKEKTLLEQAEERGKSLLEEQQKKVAAQPPVKKEEPKPDEKIEPKPEEKKPEEKEKPREYEDDDVKEFAADFPAAAKLASAEAAKLIDDKIKSGEIINQKTIEPFMRGVAEDLQTVSTTTVDAVNKLFYTVGVMSEHPDFLKIMNQGKDEFKQWFEKQPDSVKPLAGSLNYEDGVMLLNLFKASKGINTNQNKALLDSQRRRREKTNDLMSSVITGKPGSGKDAGKTHSGGEGGDEFAGAFFEAAKQIETKS